MKQTLLLFSFLISSLAMYGQFELEIYPSNPAEYTFQADLSDFWAEPIAHARVTNKSANILNLRWEREIIDAPAEWEYRICDTIACYPTSVASNVVIGGQPNAPVPLAQNEHTLMDVHVLPRGVAGCGEIAVHLSDAADPNTVIETITYNICIDPLTAVNDQFDRNQIRIFPNPTSNFISLTKNTVVRQLWVHNILGKRVRTFNTSYNGRYDLTDLPDGLYLVSMVDAEGKVIKTVRVSKRSIRA
ncbi:MAG: hypothetical protein CMN32_09995 [Saprospirales bacterium]|nr:hypothetical protein [Saprospirales bacterium]